MKIFYIMMSIGMGFVIAGISSLIYDKFHRDRYPKPVTIITAPTLPYNDREEINKDIIFEQAFNKFKVCMTEDSGIAPEECKRRFWANE